MVKVKFTRSPQLRLWCARSVAVWYDAPGCSTRVALRCVGLALLKEQASESAAVPPSTPIIALPVISAELDSTVTV